MADCRNCRYFIPLEVLERYAGLNDKWRNAYQAVQVLRDGGVRILGWCLKRWAPIRYYVGPCRYYSPHGVHNRKLTEFLKV